MFGLIFMSWNIIVIFCISTFFQVLSEKDWILNFFLPTLEKKAYLASNFLYSNLIDEKICLPVFSFSFILLEEAHPFIFSSLYTEFTHHHTQLCNAKVFFVGGLRNSWFFIWMLFAITWFGFPTKFPFSRGKKLWRKKWHLKKIHFVTNLKFLVFLGVGGVYIFMWFLCIWSSYL